MLDCKLQLSQATPIVAALVTYSSFITTVPVDSVVI
jgi:hypothetical protein